MRLTFVATGAIVDTLSGTVVTNTSNISANSGDIVIVSGLIGAGIPVATGARIDANTTNLVATGAKIDVLSGTVVTNTSNISTNATNLVATGAKIDVLSGTVVTNTSNISTNATNLVATGAKIDVFVGNGCYQHLEHLYQCD